MKKLTKSLSLLSLSLLALTGAVSVGGHKTTSRKVEAAERTNVSTFKKGNEINCDLSAEKRFNLAENQKYAVYFEYKFDGVADNPSESYVEFAILDPAWYNISGALTLWSNGTVNKSGKVTTLDGGWYGVSFDVSKFNGDWKDASTRSGLSYTAADMNMDFIYAKAGNVKLGLLIDWDTFTINKRNNVTTVEASKEISIYSKFNVSLENSAGKSLYFEYKLTGPGDCTDMAFMDNWSNITGNFRIWASGTIVVGGKNYSTIELEDGFRAAFIPVSLFTGDGTTRNKLDRAYCGAGSNLAGFVLDNNTVHMEYGRDVVASKAKELNVNWGYDLSYNAIVGNSFYFEFMPLSEGTVTVCIQQSNWKRYTAYFTFDKNTCSDGGTVVALGNGWYGVTVPFDAINHGGDTFERNTLNFLYAAGEKIQGSVAFNLDSFAVKEIKTFEMVKGASIRLDGANGIRFRANLAEKDLVQDGSYHMVIIPLDYVETYGLEEDFITELGAVPYIDMECEPQQVGDEYYIQGSIVDIKQANIARKFVPIAYTLKEGARKYAAGSADSEYARSYYEVACACAKDTAYFESLTNSQKMVLKNVIESQDYLYNATSRYFIDALDHTPRVVKELSTGLSFDKECTDVTGDSFVSWKITCSTEGVESDYPWVLIDLGSDLDITSISFDIKFENTWKWLGVNYYGSDLSLLSETSGGDLSTGWNNYEESKTISGVRYLGLCLNFDTNKGQVQSVLIDNLHVSLQ